MFARVGLYYFQKSFSLMLNRLSAAFITGLFIMVLGPWFLTGYCGPCLLSGKSGRTSIISDPLPRLASVMTPNFFNFFKNVRKERAPSLDMTGLRIYTGVGVKPGWDYAFLRRLKHRPYFMTFMLLRFA